MSGEGKDFPEDIMDQLFPDRYELHACADKLSKDKAAGFNCLKVDIEAQRKIIDEFIASLNPSCEAVLHIAEALTEWMKRCADEISSLRQRIDGNETKEVSK